jgi:flagellar biosynthesis protein FlhG
VRQPGPELLASAVNPLRLFCDVLVMDCGSGLAPLSAALIPEAQQIICVTTPDSAVAPEARAMWRALRGAETAADFAVVVNFARSSAEGQLAHQRLSAGAAPILGRSFAHLGSVPVDSRVQAAARRKAPVVLRSPGCAASRCLDAISEKLARRCRRPEPVAGCWSRIAALYG